MMRPLTGREKRTIRIGAITATVYLGLFFGIRGWQQLEGRHAAYERLYFRAQTLKAQLQAYGSKALVIDKLRKTFHFDPEKLPRSSLVAKASATIQEAAKRGRVKLGPIRESPARPSARELASMQLEATGPAPAVLGLLHNLGYLGYPLVLDSVQITAEPRRPGTLKVNLTVLILDFSEWKPKKESRDA